jgi:mannose-1-phosphate guanylyltransferase
MQALILAGGQGTRLRPLTLTTPKPVLPLAGRPFLVFMLDWLAAQGVTEAILSCGFMAERVARVLGHRYGEVSLRYVTEPEPLGTAGPLRLAVDEGGIDERLLVLNGDLLTDLDLSAQIELHAARGAIATLALVSVEDSSSYGLVPTAADGEVEAFLEKTGPAGDAPPPTNRVNGGVYVVERAIVERIPAGRAVSFEREVFPGLVGNGLFGHASDAYWIDIGTPERYLEATHDLLSGRLDSALPARDEGGSLIFPGCRVEGAEVGPLSVLGEGAIVDRRARVVRSVLYPEARVGEGAMVDGAVLAEGVVVGAGARVGEGAVIGAQTRVDDGATVEPRARVDPGVVFPATRADAWAAGYQCVHGPHSGHPAPGGSLSREELDPSGGVSNGG